MDSGKPAADRFCRRALLRTSSLGAVEYVVFPARGFRHAAHRRRSLHLCANASWSLGKDYFGLSRNHYDRFAHGAFGFLLAFPVRELLRRFSGINRRWSFWVAPAIILAVSGVFEIIESIVAEFVAPGKGVEVARRARRRMGRAKRYVGSNHRRDHDDGSRRDG